MDATQRCVVPLLAVEIPFSPPALKINGVKGYEGSQWAKARVIIVFYVRRKQLLIAVSTWELDPSIHFNLSHPAAVVIVTECEV